MSVVTLEIKNCPFCGGTPDMKKWRCFDHTRYEWVHYQYIFCTECNVSGRVVEGTRRIGEILAEWNQRARKPGEGALCLAARSGYFRWEKQQPKRKLLRPEAANALLDEISDSIKRAVREAHQ